MWPGISPLNFPLILPLWLFSIEGDARVFSFNYLPQEALLSKIIEKLKGRQALT
jgi:hypothetical protein